MNVVDLVGVGIIKYNITPTAGPRGFYAPHAGCVQDWRGRWTNSRANRARHNLLLTVKDTSTHTSKFGNGLQKTEIWPRTPKTRKNTKFVGMTSYWWKYLTKKSAAQKYQVLISRTNEGDFTINRLNSNKKSVKGLGTPRGEQEGQNPPKLLRLAGEKFLKINKIFKLGIPGGFCWQMA